MHGLLLWDFDGVIVDSIDECLLTSYNAFMQYKNPKQDFVRNINDIPETVVDFFSNTRKYVRRPGEYSVIYEAIHLNKRIDDFGQFKEILAANINGIFSYENFFFSAREKLREEDLSYWLKLHRRYPWIYKKWDKLKELFEFYIVSNKDRESIFSILRHTELSVPQDNVYGKEFSMEKKTIIKHIISETRVRNDQVYFIDDHYSHLMDVSELGIRLFFATWGYGNIEEHSNDGVVLLHPDIFDRQLLGINNG